MSLLQDYIFRSSTPYAEPAHIAQAPQPGPFWYQYLTTPLSPGITTTVMYYAPAQPVRYDTFQQLIQQTDGRAFSGSAPTRGIYTGVEEPCI